MSLFGQCRHCIFRLSTKAKEGEDNLHKSTTRNLGRALLQDKVPRHFYEGRSCHENKSTRIQSTGNLDLSFVARESSNSSDVHRLVDSLRNLAYLVAWSSLAGNGYSYKVSTLEWFKISYHWVLKLVVSSSKFELENRRQRLKFVFGFHYDDVQVEMNRWGLCAVKHADVWLNTRNFHNTSPKRFSLTIFFYLFTVFPRKAVAVVGNIGF